MARTVPSPHSTTIIGSDYVPLNRCRQCGSTAARCDCGFRRREAERLGLAEIVSELDAAFDGFEERVAERIRLSVNNRTSYVKAKRKWGGVRA